MQLLGVLAKNDPLRGVVDFEVFSRATGKDGEIGLECQLQPHQGHSRVCQKEMDSHLNPLNHHLRGQAPGRKENQIFTWRIAQPHQTRDRVHSIMTTYSSMKWRSRAPASRSRSNRVLSSHGVY